MKQKRIAVIGGGSAGVMAALRGVLNNDQITLFTGDSKTKKKSRALWVSKVHNIPGFSLFKKAITDPNKLTIEEIQNGPFKENLEVIKESVQNVEKSSDGRFRPLISLS